MLIVIALYLLIGFVMMVLVRRYDNKHLPLEHQDGMNTTFWFCVIFWLPIIIIVTGTILVDILETFVFVKPKE